jgi:arylsulfatase A-like enzyme
MDLTTSILAATGTPVPPDTRLEGIDLLPTLKGREREIERTLFWRVIGPRPQRAVRSGDWKLLFDDARPMLFNLRTDSGERTNLIGERSDIAKRLRPLLDAWQRDVDGGPARPTPPPR